MLSHIDLKSSASKDIQFSNQKIQHHEGSCNYNSYFPNNNLLLSFNLSFLTHTDYLFQSVTKHNTCRIFIFSLIRKGCLISSWTLYVMWLHCLKVGMYANMSIESEGSAVGHWKKVVQPLQFLPGHNDLVLLSQTVGLQVIDMNYKIQYAWCQYLNTCFESS